MQAWLLTWEGTGDRITAANKLIAILSARRSDSFVRDVVVLIYAHARGAAASAAHLATSRARRDELMASRSTPSRFFYGHNP
jgi:hypothetical protein